MVARGFSGAHISAARTKKQVPNFLREKKNPARARVLGSPTIARAKFLARGIAQISMICYARYLLQTYPSSSVPFFKQMYVLLVTNFCSVSGKLWVSWNLPQFGGKAIKGGNRDQKTKWKKRGNAARNRLNFSIHMSFLPTYYFSKLAIIEYQQYAPPPPRPAAARCSLRSVSFRCCCKTASVCSLLILCCCCLLVVVVVNRDGPTPRCCCCCCCC